MLKNLIFLVIIFLFSCEYNSKTLKPLNVGDSESTLIEYFQYNAKKTALISAHRGGSGIFNYPENCLETLGYIHDSIPMIFEIDISQTKDDVLVLMHDTTIDRTTNGNGLINKYTFNQLQEFNLVDDFGQETKFKIPKFNDVLNWANKKQAILTIDIKRNVDVADVVKAIKKCKAENVSIIITYNIEQAQRIYELAPNLLLSVSARNQEELNLLLQSNIPVKNMLAFTGTRLSNPKLYEELHQLGMTTMLGTLGNLDQRAVAKGDSLYLKWYREGIDIFATDRPFEVASVLKILN